jgi:hypothetical protein
VTDRELESSAQFLAQAKRVLDETSLDAGVASRLAAARRLAVATFDARSSTPRVPPRWVPAGALATTVFAIGLATVAMDTRTLPAVDDARAFAVAQDVELLDDLEFLAWLPDEDHAS